MEGVGGKGWRGRLSKVLEGGADGGMRVMRGSEGNGQQGFGRVPCRGIEIRGGSSMEGQQEIMRRVWDGF